MKMFTAKESEKLDYLLSKVEIREEALCLEELHGLLFGLAITPEPIMPSEWFPEIFGPKGPIFESDQDAQACIQSLMNAYNRINSESSKGSLRFPFEYDKMTDDEFDLVEGWAYGLFLALTLRPEIWGITEEYENVNEEESSPELMEVIDACEIITAIALPEKRNEIIGTLPGHPPKSDEEIEEIIYKMLPVCVQIIQAFGEKKRQARPGKHYGSDTPYSTKTGRNELCPCGSGRKYKKCCGAN